MAQPICPHCGKVFEGEVLDKEIYLVVICDECQTILGVLPKFFQKCTWKRQPEKEEAETEEEPEEVVVGGVAKRNDRARRTWD
jgi:hypothetical protein